MAHTSNAIPVDSDEYLNEEDCKKAKEVQQAYFDHHDFIHRTPWWFISIIFHTALLLMAAIWTISRADKAETFSIFEMNVKKFKKPEYDPTLKRDIKRTNKQIKDEVVVENPVITKEDLEIDELETPNDMEREHKAKGRQEAISTIELGGDGWVGVFGVGGGGSGAYGWRDGGGKRRAIGRFGGGAATESAVLAALRWFKRHQAQDGSWSFEDYHNECKLNPPCKHVPEVLTHGAVAGGKKNRKLKNAATGFALLCFLGAGHTHKAGKFRQQVADGLSYLIKSQENDGSFCIGNYIHAIATMAAAEAYGMTMSAHLKEPVEKAVSIILARQNEYMGWNYLVPRGRSDISISGWNVMALKSAKASHIDIGNGFEGASRFLEKITPGVKGGPSEPILEDHVAYQYLEGKDSPGHRNATLTAIGMLCRVFIGEDTDGEMLRAHANMVLKETPRTFDEANMYQMYYATLAMFQMGGRYWKEWNNSMKKILCENQCKGGCEDGSWYIDDPVWYNQIGRLFHTAVGCLSLEVYYRYLPVSMLK